MPAFTCARFDRRPGPPEGRYSAAIRTGCSGRARKRASSSASRLLTSARLRSFTWPKPRIFSGALASSTASWWFPAFSPASNPRPAFRTPRPTPLSAPFLGPSERVEGGAAQAPEPRQQAERAQHPGPVAALAQVAGDGIAVGQERRGQMELEPVPALELAAELPQEASRRSRAGRPRTRP